MSNSSAAPYAVNIDRVIEAMATFEVELERHNEEVATAVLNEHPVTFAVLGSVAIVRADGLAPAISEALLPSLYLAANQINCVSFGASACVIDRGNHSKHSEHSEHSEDSEHSEHGKQRLIRTERDIPIAAGMNDTQLRATLRLAVDSTLSAQDAMLAAIEEYTKMATENSGEGMEADTQ